MINALTVYRAGSALTIFDIDESTVYDEKIPGTKLITCPVTAATALPILPGDYIIWNGENYVIHLLPDFDKSAAYTTKKYNIVFEAEFYQFLDEYVISSIGLKTFPYYGTAAQHLQLIINNANRDSSGWSVGTVDTSVAQIINYDWNYCRESLDTVAAAFGLEYQFVGRVLNMVATVGRNTNINVQMGRGKGLQSISRKPDTNKNIINRVYAIGGTRNIDSTYRNGIEPNLIIEGYYIETPEVTAKTESVKEGKYSNDLIFPQYKGSVTSSTVTSNADGSVNYVTITDTAIDFDVMAQLQAGVTAKVGFLTGKLTGIEFEVSAFNFATKIVTLINNTDSNGYITPNTLDLPVVGDTFTFYDIRMPAAYVATAEAALLAAATIFLNDNSEQNIIFSVQTDQKYLRDNSISIKCGDTVTLTDTDLNLSNQVLRFTEISYPLVNEYNITGVIGNSIVYDQVVKLFADVNENHQQIEVITRQGLETAKRGATNLRALQTSIFDTDGLFDTDKMNIGVLSAALGIFGTKSSDFILNSVYITDNFGADPNAVNISAGQLIHLEISNPGNLNIWEMQALTQSGLVPASLYYVYSKCSKTSQVGSFVVTTDQIVYDSLSGFYMFLTGVIYPIIDGTRDSDFEYGITTINAGRIKTGVLESHTGNMTISLDTGEIFGIITFRSAAGVTTNITDVQTAAILAQTNATNAQTIANSAQTAAGNAQTSANSAVTSAAVANSELADIANDNLLTVSEKPDVLQDWQVIQAEKSVIDASAATYSLSTTSYDNSYTALSTYVTPLLTNMAVNTVIDGPTFRTNFNNYYTAKINLTKLISDAAKSISDAAQVTANNAQIVANNASGSAGTALTNSNNALTAANNAITSAATANALLADIANDNILAPSEKPDVLLDLQSAQGEYATIIAQAGTYSLSTASYTAYYNTLVSYITPLLSSMTTNSTIVGTTFRTNFVNYYNAKQSLLQAISDAAKTLVNNIQIGGRNYFTNTSALSLAAPALAYHVNAINGLPIDGSQTNGMAYDHGLFIVGNSSGAVSTLRVPNVITGNGNWNVSGWIFTNSSYTLESDICDSVPSFTINLPNGVWTYFSYTQVVINYSSSVYNFVDFGGIPYVYLYIKDLKIEQGNKASDWTAAPDDTQAAIALAQTAATNAASAASLASTQAATANQLLADIANDNILAPSEKPQVLQDINTIQGEVNIIGAQANSYSLSTADFSAKYNTLITYITPLLANMNVNSAIVGTTFRANFVNYYNSRQTLLQAISDAAKTYAASLVANIQIGGRNYFQQATTLGSGNNSMSLLQHGSAANTSDNGIYAIGTPSTVSGFRVNNVITQNGYWTISGYISGNGSYTLGIDICDNIGANVTVLNGVFTYFSVTVNVQNWTASTYNFVDFSNIPYVYFYLKNFKVEQGNKATDWTASPEDVTALTQQIANSVASVAQASAISTASADASSKANAAYSTAVSAAGTDASSKANTAYSQAQTYADGKYTALTASLKALAYQDVVQTSQLGTTVISGGMLVNTLIDTNYVRANIINAGYINTLSLAAVQGTIGGIVIQSNAITSANGLFSVSSAGLLTAANANITGTLNSTVGTISGFTLDTTGLSNQSTYINGALSTGPGNGRIIIGKKFYNGSGALTGAAVVAIGNYAIPGYGDTQNTLAYIDNEFPNTTANSVNTALFVSAAGAAGANYALHIEAGDVYIKGAIGATTNINAGGAHMSFVNGFYVGPW